MTDAEKLAALEEAMASGARKVKYRDHEVEYNSFDDMVRARNFLLKKMGRDTNPTRRTPCFSKGLD
jgi:hypothetical protein